MRHQITPSVNVLIINGSKILLSRRANTGWMDGQLCLPGGHVEVGETPSAAILREIHEELGASVKLTELEFVCVADRKHPDGEYVSFVFALVDKNYDYQNTEPEKCSELVWEDINELPVDILDFCREAITQGFIGRTPYLELSF